MSRTQYLKHLEIALSASQKIINDLTEENYQLRELLKESSRTNEPKIQARSCQY